MSDLPSGKRTSVVDFVNPAAVVLSPIYVGYEIRENTNAVLQETNQSLITMAHDNFRSLFEEKFAQTVIQGSGDYSSLEPLEKIQFDTHVRLSLDIWEHAYYSHVGGMMRAELWRAWNAGLLNELASPFWQQVWNQYHESYGQEFQTHVNSRSRADD